MLFIDCKAPNIAMQEYEKEKLGYEQCMKDSLGHSWDFCLLDNRVRGLDRC